MKNFLYVLAASSSLLGTAHASPSPTTTPDIACSTLVWRGDSLLALSNASPPRTVLAGSQAKGVQSAISPDGSLIALFRAGARDFSIVDSSGRQLKFDTVRPAVDVTADDPKSPSNTSQAPLLDVRIVDDNVVRVRKHAGKDVSRFEFYRLEGASLRQLAPPVVGTVCAVESHSRRTACVLNDEIVMDGNTVLRAQAGAGPVLETLHLRSGASSAVSVVKGLVVQVMSAQSEIGLRVQLPTGNWVQSRVRAGESLTVPTPRGDIVLRPQLRGAGVVEITVSNSSSGAAALSPILSWMPNGMALVAVENTSRGSVISLLRAQPGGRWQESRSTAVANQVDAVGIGRSGGVWYRSGTRFGSVRETAPGELKLSAPGATTWPAINPSARELIPAPSWSCH